MRSYKIAIIDDQADFLRELSETLEMAGYKTFLFRKAVNALMEVPKIMPDVILLDLRLNGLSGKEVAFALRNDEKTKDIPIIVMTAYYNKKDHDDLKRVCKVERCLKKPLKPLQVLTAIERHIR